MTFLIDPRYSDTVDWQTPKWLLESFPAGWFDLDPCKSIHQFYHAAEVGYTIRDDGLSKTWAGNIWLNPPYGEYLNTWVSRMAAHNKGIALLFNRSDTKTFQNIIYPTCTGILAIQGRLEFIKPNGTPGKATAPSVLIAWGENNYNQLGYMLNDKRLKGALIKVDKTSNKYYCYPNLPGIK